MLKKIIWTLVGALTLIGSAGADVVKIGLNYPETGPYSVQGLAQLRAAKMAAEEINNAGGILGKTVELAIRDSQSKPYITQRNVEELIDKEGCEMIFGGSASSVAIAGGKAARSREKLYFGTLTYSNATTGSEGHKYMFRECYNAWMGAKVLGKYLRETFIGKKYFFVTADYTWGWTTEESIRQFSNTDDRRTHRRAYTPFPGATEADFSNALQKAAASRADVLVLVLFGKDMAEALQQAQKMGLKNAMSIVVPNVTLGMAETAGPEAMAGVVGALPWCWNIPFLYNYERGKRFVLDFAGRYNSYPSTSAASAYTILYQYKEAVERAGTFDSRPVINALEGRRFTLLKDEQQWRDFDHQCVQTVYAVRCKPQSEVYKDRFRQDFFEIINEMSGYEAAKTKMEWIEERKAAGKPEVLEW